MKTDFKQGQRRIRRKGIKKCKVKVRAAKENDQRKGCRKQTAVVVVVVVTTTNERKPTE
jgi:hypothetical protein